jgi:multicomponent K+:H+ antiporter subunit F
VITSLVLPWVIGALILAMVLVLIRLLRGPSVADRVLALDTLYVTALALVIVLGIKDNNPVYFEVALLIAMLGFFGTVVLARYLARGKVIE